MKRIYLIVLTLLLTGSQLFAQCTFEELFPLKWGASKYAINEHFVTDPVFQKGSDTLHMSVFKHGLDYFFTVRNMSLSFYSYNNKITHPCFGSGVVVLNCIANDSGLVAYNYQITFAADKRAEYLAVIDSMKIMMNNKFTYHSNVEVKTEAKDPSGKLLSGDGVCIYYDKEPIIPTNLTYPQYVIRGGYLANKSVKSSDPKVITNQAEEIKYYRIEILYKMPRIK